jgi:hypothetical protein
MKTVVYIVKVQHLMAWFYGNVFRTESTGDCYNKACTTPENEVNVLHTSLTTRILKKNFLGCPLSYEDKLERKMGLFQIQVVSVPTEPR